MVESEGAVQMMDFSVMNNETVDQGDEHDVTKSPMRLRLRPGTRRCPQQRLSARLLLPELSSRPTLPHSTANIASQLWSDDFLSKRGLGTAAWLCAPESRHTGSR